MIQLKLLTTPSVNHVTSSTADTEILVNNKLDEYQSLLLCLFIIREAKPIRTTRALSPQHNKFGFDFTNVRRELETLADARTAIITFGMLPKGSIKI